MRPSSITIALFLGFTGLGLAMALPSLDNPWFWDDLYWFRDYSFDEIASTWTGTNDPNRVGVPGYRPLHALSNFARYELFGESAAANRVLTVVAIGAALSLLVYSLRRLGVPLVVGASAALLALTSKNLTYTYAWASDGYQGLQMATFGGVLACLASGLHRPRRRDRWLAAAALLWAVTLMLKDQGVLLLPVVLAFSLLGAGGGIDAIVDGRDGDSVRALLRAVGERIRVAWALVSVRRFVIAVTAFALASFAARLVFVPEANPAAPSLRSFAATLAWTASLAGNEDDPLAGVIYCSVAFVAFCLWLIASRRLRSREVVASWLVTGLSVCAVAFTALYGFHPATRADIVNFPLFFYGLYLASSAWLLVSLLREHATARRFAIALGTAAIAVSVFLSVRASVGVQDAMGEGSIQVLAKDYKIIFGHRLAVPAERRAHVEAELRRVDITRPLPGDAQAANDPRDHAFYHAFSFLYCRQLRDPSFPAYIPRIFAWGDEAVRIPDCASSSFASPGVRARGIFAN